VIATVENVSTNDVGGPGGAGRSGIVIVRYPLPV
jgi:hypothetical protein